jgi:hypothetical protein
MLPTIPTDNLFKFLAISGLIMAGFCVWMSNDLENRLRTNEVIARDQYIEFMGEMEAKMNAMVAKIEMKETLQLTLAVPDTNGNLVQIRPGTRYPLAIEEKYRDGYRRIITFWDDWLASCLPYGGRVPNVGDTVFTTDAVKDLRGKLRLHAMAIENLWRQMDNTITYRTWALWGTILGLLASSAGFVFWVFDQKRQDRFEGLRIEKDKEELNTPVIGVDPTVVSPTAT